MAKAAAKGRGRESAQAPRYRFVRESAGVAMVALSLLSVLALFSYEPADPIFSSEGVSNAAGRFGAALAAVLVGSLGFSSVVAVGVLAYLGTRLVVGAQMAKPGSRVWVGVGLLVLALSVLPSLLVGLLPSGIGVFEEGALGGFLVGYETWLFGTWGSVLLNGLILVTGLLAVLGLSPARGLVAVGMAVGWVGASVLDLAARIGNAFLDGQAAVRRGAGHLMTGARRGVQAVLVKREQRARRVRVAAARAPEPEATSSTVVEIAAAEVPAEVPTRSRPARGADPVIVDHGEERKKGVEVRQETFTFNELTKTGPYVHPEVSIFQRPATGAKTYDRESLIMNSRILEKKLQDFGVGGQVDKVHPGPVITMYEFEPASGVKVNRIVSLSDDLALALRALSVRIIAPLPGKSVVGIEVANAERDNVYIRDILECDEYRSDASKLMIALGKDIFGNPSFADLARMPHLLVAGATGTGKSVFLNSLLCSILGRATPDDLKLLLVDPKLLELSIYEGIPHLIADVVTNPKRAAAALQGIVHKMEERYQMMSALGVRSIQQFNERAAQELADGNKTFRLRPKPGEEEGEEVEFHHLPYIVVVIDELADLMVVSARDVEEALQRLAQMARAAGIHLILATQRPSVDVLTGVIKANFPARVSFQVSSRTDSRTILDQNGAETLLGQGDMLFLPPGTSKLQRVHGAFVTEEEVHTLVAHLREQGSPSFDETLIRSEEESEAREGRGEEVDEMFDRAVAIVAETRNASISYVQRRLKVGYNRAARMVEQMEEEGIVGPQVGNKPREVFARPPEP
ncbi:DNA translocase FtsK 4TM domain-containing protein [Myxococcota bacterium]|nr:DNA translocase FtsK 4TM domain-containing protein [Myxococcota bacterium]